MVTRADVACLGITPSSFVCEATDFRACVADPALSPQDKERAYDLLVKHATMLDPHDAGYEGAGVALKQAVCTWLDSKIDSKFRG
jgi:hypothetical protein